MAKQRNQKLYVSAVEAAIILAGSESALANFSSPIVQESNWNQETQKAITEMKTAFSSISRKLAKPEIRHDFTSDECYAISMAIAHVKEIGTHQHSIAAKYGLPFSTIYNALENLIRKFEKVTGIEVKLPDYNEGDEDEFLEK